MLNNFHGLSHLGSQILCGISSSFWYPEIYIPIFGKVGGLPSKVMTYYGSIPHPLGLMWACGNLGRYHLDLGWGG